MIKFLSQLLDLIYKKRCYFCRSTDSGNLMCENCFESIEFLPCKIFRNINGCQVFCASVYKDNLQKLIRGLKYHNKKELAYFQAKLMYEYWKKLTVSEKKFVIVPVPLYSKREKQRGYNHMLLVAHEFAKLAGENYIVENNLIKRIKNTKPQYKLSKAQREQNLKNAFEITKNCDKFKNKNILIFDDILTTGSTLEEMIKVFKQNGFENLYAFTTSCAKHSF